MALKGFGLLGISEWGLHFVFNFSPRKGNCAVVPEGVGGAVWPELCAGCRESAGLQVRGRERHPPPPRPEAGLSCRGSWAPPPGGSAIYQDPRRSRDKAGVLRAKVSHPDPGVKSRSRHPRTRCPWQPHPESAVVHCARRDAGA